MKKVLFIGIDFYDYDQAIINEFNSLGFKVDYYSERSTSFKARIVCRTKNQRLIQRIITERNHKIVNSSANDYDIVFVIKCENLSIVSLKKIKQKNPNACFILYLWDSMNRIPDIKIKFSYFNKIYSFDRINCLDNDKLIFNPLFYRNEFDIKEIGNDTYKRDIFFLGWNHSDRLALIKKIAALCDEKKLSYKMILYTGKVAYWLDCLFNRTLKHNKSFLIFKPLPTKDLIYEIFESRSVLDIAHPKQSGLTIRTIELLALRKKIITTNADIVNYDFYNPANILVIDRNNPELPESFFTLEYHPISEEIRERYAISNWLRRMVIPNQ